MRGRCYNEPFQYWCYLCLPVEEQLECRSCTLLTGLAPYHHTIFVLLLTTCSVHSLNCPVSRAKRRWGRHGLMSMKVVWASRNLLGLLCPIMQAIQFSDPGVSRQHSSQRRWVGIPWGILPRQKRSAAKSYRKHHLRRRRAFVAQHSHLLPFVALSCLPCHSRLLHSYNTLSHPSEVLLLEGCCYEAVEVLPIYIFSFALNILWVLSQEIRESNPFQCLLMRDSIYIFAGTNRSLRWRSQDHLT